MAQKVQIQIVDDLDGSDAAETVSFALDGVAYEIDLSLKNAAVLRDSLAPFIAAGRRVAGRRSTRLAVASSADNAAMRAWAKSAGYQISDRGRVSAEIRAAYAAAH